MPKFERRHDAERERESKPDSRAERLARVKEQLAETERDADEAGKAVQEARAYAASHEGRHDPASKAELAAIEKDADAALKRFEDLRKRMEILENPDALEGAIAEEMVTDAVIAAVVPEPFHLMAEAAAPAVKGIVEAETEETPEERRRKKLGEKKRKE